MLAALLGLDLCSERTEMACYRWSSGILSGFRPCRGARTLLGGFNGGCGPRHGPFVKRCGLNAALFCHGGRIVFWILEQRPCSEGDPFGSPLCPTGVIFRS